MDEVENSLTEACWTA